MTHVHCCWNTGKCGQCHTRPSVARGVVTWWLGTRLWASYPAWSCDFTPLSLWCPPGVDELGTGTPMNEDWGVTEPAEALLCPWALQGLSTGCCGPSHCALLLNAHGPSLEFLPQLPGPLCTASSFIYSVNKYLCSVCYVPRVGIRQHQDESPPP